MKKPLTNFAFIDSQNLNLSVREQGWLLDYRKFRTYLRDSHSVMKAFLFICYVHTNQLLYTALQEYCYVLVFKPTLVLPSGKSNGKVDVELVLYYMVNNAN